MRTFQATQWLQTSEKKKVISTNNKLDSYSRLLGTTNTNEGTFSPSNFLIPGWKGGSLFSKSALIVKKAQESLWKDAFHQFYRLENPNKSFRITVFNEFKEGYAFKNRVIPEELQNIDHFWNDLKDKNSPYHKNLIKFVEIYSFRVATVYLYKAKFLTALSDSLPYPLDINKLRSPNSTLSKIFQKGSSRELNCHSLQSNQYSWFRPSSNNNTQLSNLLIHLRRIDISQLMKLSTYRGYNKTKGNINFNDNNYSHALSHCSYGKFLNNLLIFFPIWHKSSSFHYPQKIQKYPQIFNTKFEGTKLHSLCHSHWLAQESNLDLKWSELICPEFINSNEHENSFTKICHEIHFLTFLVKFSTTQNYPVKDIICHTFDNKYRSSANDLSGQFSLFSKTTFGSPIRHSRIVLNITELPKKNPYHFLSNKILDQKGKLCPNGYLYVLTNQNLFVASQSQKLKKILEEYSIEARFNLDGVQGKGDIASYIYVLKSREAKHNSANHQFKDLFAETAKTEQDQCLSFIWRGEINHFGQFDKIVSNLYDFFLKRSSKKVSMIHNKVGENLIFEFHQDAIIDGRLLSSSNDDDKSIAHPHFFKKLTENCSPLETFFLIESLDKKREQVTSDFLGISLTNTFKHQYVLVADLRDPHYTNIDIIPSNAYEGMKEKNGVAYFQYFALTPKIAQMNINIFKEYFNSQIGRQIIKLTLSGGSTMMKSKLGSLLIPSFFAESGKRIDLEDQKALSLIKTDIKDLLSMSPLALKENIEHFFNAISKNEKTNPWMILGVLSQIKSKLVEYESNSIHGLIQYNNPLILTPLLKLESFPVYPNKDIFLKILVEKNEDLHLPLSKIKFLRDEEQDTLSLISGEKEILRLYGDKNLLLFIKFILTSTEGRPIFQIISNLKIPSAVELEEILTNFDTVKGVISLFKADVTNRIESIIKSTI